MERRIQAEARASRYAEALEWIVQVNACDYEYLEDEDVTKPTDSASEKNSWCYAEVEDAECWGSADTRDEAIANGAAQAEANGDETFCVAPAIPIKLEDLTVRVSAEMIFDDIVDNNDLPETAHEWFLDLKNTGELEAEIEETVRRWLCARPNKPEWYSVGKVETLQTKDYAEPAI